MSSEFAQAIYLNSPASANLDIGGIGVRTTPFRVLEFSGG